MKPSLLTWLFILQCTGQPTDNNCPQYWTAHQDSCYVIIHNLSPWAAAEEMCKDFGAYLVEVDDEEENNFLTGMIAAEPHGQIRFWMGGTDLLSEGAWIWSHSGHDVSYSDWSPGGPSNSGGMENCMEFHLDSGHYDWNDNRCSTPQFFICEQDASTSPVLG